jgi:hypothetical protein
VAADGAKAGQVLRVMYPHSDDWKDGDRALLRTLTELHGGEFPSTEMSSLPGKVDLWFPDAACEEAFRSSLRVEGRFSIGARQPFRLPNNPRS